MAVTGEGKREGSLEAPTRHPLDWTSAGFYDEQALVSELERVFDICHGCRRCFSLCNAFPTLFDAIDGSESMELDGVPLDPDKEYAVAGWASVQEQPDGVPIWDVVTEYLRAKKTISHIALNEPKLKNVGDNPGLA